jgi:hypothetical protein
MKQQPEQFMTNSEASVTPGDLCSEKDVMDRFGHLLTERELREARQAGRIGYYDLRKGIFYTEPQVMAYLALSEKAPCRNAKLDPEKEAPLASSRSEPTGSGRRPGASISSIIGMTPRLEERAAERLERET